MANTATAENRRVSDFSLAPVCVGLAFARPKMMRRVIHTCGQFGIEHLVFYRSYLCEKSYETSGFYDIDSLEEAYRDGTRQTRFFGQNPAFEFFSGFKPFIEEFVLENFENDQVVFLDPDGKPLHGPDTRSLLVFGPERGLTDRERCLVESYGLAEIQLGPLHLRLETAVPFAFGALGGLTSFS